MKKIIVNSIVFIFATMLIASCDFVHNANPEITPTVGNSSDSNIIYRKAFVEDYTGHQCGNCPKAADQLKSLEASYPDKIVPLAVHAGFFAATNATYPTDFKTTVGTAYDTKFGNSAAGNPNGLINRIGYGTSSFIKNYTAWAGQVASIVAMPAKFQIKIKNTFNSTTKVLDTDITVKSLAANTGMYKLVVLLTEDSVIAEQLDYRILSPPAPNQIKTDYEFNHLLRGAINSTWGDAIFTSGAAALNDSVVKSYTGFPINASYRPKKCHVVAYVYDADAVSPTYYEVYQAEEAHVEE